MRNFAIAGIAALAIAGSTAVYAQHRDWGYRHVRMNPEDRAAFADARIAAVHAGLKLTADQEKLWPPLEAAVRDLVKLRIDRANARMDADKKASANAPKPDSADVQKDAQKTDDDPVARLRERAERMAASAAAMKKIADAADPLYKTLDDGQKRRLTMLAHMGHRGGGGEGWRHRGFYRDRDGDRVGGGGDRGYGRNRYDQNDRDDEPAQDGSGRL